MSTVTSKGQVTLPKWIRDELGLVPGSEVEFKIGGGWVFLRKNALQERFVCREELYRGKLPGDLVDDLVHHLCSMHSTELMDN